MYDVPKPVLDDSSAAAVQSEFVKTMKNVFSLQFTIQTNHAYFFRKIESMKLLGEGFPSPPIPSSSTTLSSPLSSHSHPLPPIRSKTPEIKLEGLGERCKLPQLRFRRSPSRYRIWCSFRLEICLTSGGNNFNDFSQNQLTKTMDKNDKSVPS